MRIKNHPILNIPEQKEIKFYFNNKEYFGIEGETVIAALIANNISTLAYSHNEKRPRGMFCANGKCSACLMEVNGKRNVRVCITKLEENMRVNVQK